MQIYQPLMIEPQDRHEEPAPLRLKDALGRHFVFPWNWCQTWKRMEELIQVVFGPPHLNVIAEHVHKGHYILKNAKGETILPVCWRSVLQSGMIIEMEMWSMPELETVDIAEARRMAPRDPDTPFGFDLMPDDGTDRAASPARASTGSEALVEENKRLPGITAEDLVQLLFCNGKTSVLNSAALKDPQIGEYRTYRKLFSLLIQFGQALSQSTMTRNQHRVIGLLRSVRTCLHMALLIIEHTKRTARFVDELNSPQCQWQMMSESEWDEKFDILDWEAKIPACPTTDCVDEISVERDEDIRQIGRLLSMSPAYMAYLSQLLDFVHQPYRLRLTEALGDRISSARGMAVRPEWKENIAFQLSWVPPKLIGGDWEEKSAFWCFSNEIKLQIERWLGDRLHWTPWHPPQPSVASYDPGRKWKTVS